VAARRATNGWRRLHLGRTIGSSECDECDLFNLLLALVGPKLWRRVMATRSQRTSTSGALFLTGNCIENCTSRPLCTNTQRVVCTTHCVYYTVPSTQSALHTLSRAQSPIRPMSPTHSQRTSNGLAVHSQCSSNALSQCTSNELPAGPKWRPHTRPKGSNFGQN